MIQQEQGQNGGGGDGENNDMAAAAAQQLQQQPQIQQSGPPQQQQQSTCPPDCTIWMGDLDIEWDSNFIREAFGKHNAGIANVKMVTTDHGQKKATYCFVEFRDEESARAAILDVNGKAFMNDPTGRARFNLAFANSPNHMSIEYNLFVNNLATDVDDVVLFRLFGERYRSCRGAKVYRHEDGSSKEQGFVRFTSQTDQQTALVEMNKQHFHGRELYLKLARPKTRGTGRYGGYSYGPRGGGGPPGSMMMGTSGGFHHQHAGAYIVGQMPTMPGLLGVGGPMPYGMAGLMPGGVPIQMATAATPYGTQLAPNHGMAGFGGAPAPHFMGQPFIVSAGGYPQQNAYIQPQLNMMHPTHQMMAAGPVGGLPFPGQMAPAVPHFNPKPPEVPPPPVFEDVEPMSAAEHNALLLNSTAEFQTALEASRWNAVAFGPDTTRKDLYHMIHSSMLPQ